MAAVVVVRKAVPTDYDAIADVMFDAVRNGRSAYSEPQRQAWQPDDSPGPEWSKRLDEQTVFVAEDLVQLLGFMSLASEGYIDLAFIRPLAQGTGLFRRLYSEVEDLARKTKQRRLWLHASLNAQTAFSTMGFIVTRRETVEIRGQFLERFEMEKQLRHGE